MTLTSPHRVRRAFATVVAPWTLVCLALAPGLADAQRIVGTITLPTAGAKISDIAVYEAGRKLLVTVDGSSGLLVYDVDSLALVTAVSLGGEPFELVVHQGTGNVYAALEDRIAVVSAVTSELIGTIPVAVAELVLDEGLNRAYGLLPPFWDNLAVVDLTNGTHETRPIHGSPLTWDLVVNPVTHDVFVGRGPTLQVFDAETLTSFEVGDMSGFGLVVNPIDNKVYSININNVGIYDREDGTVTWLVTMNDAMTPRNYAFDPVGDRLFIGSEVNSVATVLDGSSDRFHNLPIFSFTSAVGMRSATGHAYFVGHVGVPFVAVLDGTTEIAATIPLPNQATTHTNMDAVAIHQGAGRVFAVHDRLGTAVITVLQDEDPISRPPVYVGVPNGYRTAVIDPVTHAIVDEWYPTYAEQGLAVRPGTGVVFEPTSYGAYDFGTAKVRSYTGTGNFPFLGTFPFTEVHEDHDAEPATLAFTPDGATAWITSSRLGTVSAADVVNERGLGDVAVGNTPWGVAVTPDGAKAYVACKGGNHVTVVDTATQTVRSVIAVGESPWGVALNPAGTRAFVTIEGDGTLSVIDTTTDSVIATVATGSQPHWAAVTPDGRQVWVSNYGSDTVSIVDAASAAPIATVPVGQQPEGIAFLPNGSEAYVATATTATVVATSDLSTTPIERWPFPEDGHVIPVAIPDTGARIAGHVASWGCPVAGATVHALPPTNGTAVFAEREVVASATTDANGDYSLFNLAGSEYEIEVTAAGFAPAAIPKQTYGAGLAALHNLELDPSPCALSCCRALVPSRAVAGAPSSFQAPRPPPCANGEISYLWDFGDGTPPSQEREPNHTYSQPGEFPWTVRVGWDDQSCTSSGTTSVGPACVLTCEGMTWHEAVGLPPISRLSDSESLLGEATAKGCVGSLTYRWEAGDGTAPEWRTNLASHHYEVAGTYTWRFTVWAGTTECSDTGDIQVLADERLVVFDGATPITEGQTTPIVFDQAVLGGPGITKTFTVRNDGGYPIELGHVDVPTGFTLIEGLQGPLVAGAADTFTVRLESGSLGPHTGFIEFWTNADHGGYFTFPVSGVVTLPSRRVWRHL